MFAEFLVNAHNRVIVLKKGVWKERNGTMEGKQKKGQKGKESKKSYTCKEQKYRI
jgi:hypothetical protein